MSLCARYCTMLCFVAGVGLASARGDCVTKGPLDIIMVVDRSGDLNNDDGNTMIAALTFASALQVGYGDDDPLVYRLALITYDDDVSIHLHLNAGGDYANISNAFFTHMSGGPDGPDTANLHEALSAAIGEFKDNGNPFAKPVLVTVTDGQSSNKPLTLTQTLRVHDTSIDGKFIYSLVVQLGRNPDEEVIEALATDSRPLLKYNSAAEWTDDETPATLESNTIATTICESETASATSHTTLAKTNMLKTTTSETTASISTMQLHITQKGQSLTSEPARDISSTVAWSTKPSDGQVTKSTTDTPMKSTLPIGKPGTTYSTAMMAPAVTNVATGTTTYVTMPALTTEISTASNSVIKHTTSQQCVSSRGTLVEEPAFLVTIGFVAGVTLTISGVLLMSCINRCVIKRS